MNWEPSMDPYELRESIGENLEETCQPGDKAFPCAGYRDHYRRGREGYPWHWHDEWEIAFVEQGQVRAQVNGEQHLLGPGEGIFINRRVLHAFSLEGNGEVWMPNLLFLPSLLYGSQESVFWEKYTKPLAFSTGCTHLVLRQDVPWQREALAQAGRAYALLEEAADGYALRVRSGLCAVLVAGAGQRPALPRRGTTPSLCGWRTSLPACSSAGGSACGLFKMCWASPPSNTSSSCGCARQRSFCWRQG